MLSDDDNCSDDSSDSTDSDFEMENNIQEHFESPSVKIKQDDFKRNKFINKEKLQIFKKSVSNLRKHNRELFLIDQQVKQKEVQDKVMKIVK